MKPTKTIHYATGESSLGTVVVAVSEAGVCAVLIGSQLDALHKDLRARLYKRFPRCQLLPEDNLQALASVIAYIENTVGAASQSPLVSKSQSPPAGNWDLPLDAGGTDFQQRVWQTLRQIPPGSTLTYRQVAERMGAPTSTRAVAAACAANPIAVVVPCHRVVRQDGQDSGYRWGLPLKRQLLKREAAHE